MPKYTAHSIEFDFLDETGSAITPVTIGALTSTGHPLNTETTGDDTGGIFDTARSLVSQLPEPTYTTKSIQAILQILGLTGQCFSSDVSHPGVRLYGQVVSGCKNYPASTANLRYTIPAGLIVPQTLSVDRTGDATLSFAVHALTDGSNAPFSGDYSGITLPSNPISNKYGIGNFRIANILWREPTSYNLEFGITIDDKLPAIGGVWAETTGVRKSQPRLNITGQDPTMLDDTTGIPLLGGNAVHANTVIQLMKKKNGAGGYEDSASTVHFRMTMDGLVIVEDPFSTSGDGIADSTSRVEATHDGTNAPVVFAFNQAYSSTAA